MPDRTRALLVGYQAHIAKPLEPTELLATIASVERLQQAMAGLSVSQKRETSRLLRALSSHARRTIGERTTEDD